MDPASEQGLATPSLHHGCSTVDSESGWTIVKNNKKNYKNKVSTSAPVQRTSKSEIDSSGKMNETESTKKGSPPYKDKNNMFAELQDNTEADDDDSTNTKSTVKMDTLKNNNHAQIEPPKKKMKKEEPAEEDFFDVCDEMAKLPPVEYACSASSKRVVFNYKLCHDDEVKCDPTEPDYINAPPPRMKINENTLLEIEATKSILNYDDTGETFNLDIANNTDIESIRHNFDILNKDPDYQQYLHQARTLPKTYDCVYPVMKNELLKTNDDWDYNYGGRHYGNWISNGKRTKLEQQREESTFLMYEIQRNNMMQRYKLHYEMMERTMDQWRIPYEVRGRFRTHELNYVSLMLHDMMPRSYMDYLLPSDQEPQGLIYQFFHKTDDVETARQKWYAAIKKDYNRFFEVLLSPYCVLTTATHEDCIMMYDLEDIVRFINPVAMEQVYSTPKLLSRLESICSRGRINANNCSSRHPFLYEWLYFGWRILPDNYPLHKQQQHPNINTITNWVHVLTTHHEYITKDLYSTVNQDGYVANIKLSYYYFSGEKWWELDTYMAEESSEMCGENYGNLDGENGLKIRDRHWLYEENWHDIGECLYDKLYQTRSDHNVISRMSILNAKEEEYHSKSMTWLKQDIKRKIEKTNGLLVNYFKNELRAHYDFEWINLESLYWEDYTYEYTYYVPIRHKISPDWLVWQVNGRRPVPDFSALQQRKYYTKYSVFLPANTNYSPSVQNVRTGTWNKNILNNVMQSPLSSIKKRSLWARI